MTPRAPLSDFLPDFFRFFLKKGLTNRILRDMMYYATGCIAREEVSHGHTAQARIAGRVRAVRDPERGLVVP